MSKTFRRVALAGLLTVSAALCVPAMLAQHPGAPPPPAPPPPPSGPVGGVTIGGGIGITPGGPMRSPNGPPNIPGNAMHRSSALGLPGRWWNDRQVINRLNLRPNQQKQMDAIFEAHRAALSDSLQNLQRERAQLGSLSRKDLQDENKVLAAIDRVVAARADLAKQTTQVLGDLRKQLDPQQTATLDKEITNSRQ